jgi:hypothetical protein
METSYIGGSNNMAPVVMVYQCFFFSAGRIEYWENIESNSDGAIQALLSQRLSTEYWEAAEAWAQDKLICRIAAPVGRPVSARVDGSLVHDLLPSDAAARA